MKKFILLLLIAGTFSVRAQTDAGQDNDALPALVQVLGQTDDAQFHFDILKGMSDGLKGRRGVKMPAGWDAVATKLSQSANPEVRALVQSLSLTFGSAAALASLQQTLMDPKADAVARKSALDSLLQTKDPALVASLQQLLKDATMRGVAMRGLAAYEDAKTPPAILAIYGSLTGVEKKDALNTLVSRLTFAKPLLLAVAGKTVPARDLTADIVRQLRIFKNPEIDQQVQKLWGVSRDTEADKLKEIAKYKAMIAAKGLGNASRGRAMFSLACQQCHTLFDTGGKVGPDITGSNRSDLDYILQNVIDPNAVIPNDYRTSTLETKDDRVITGIVTKQDDTSVTIVVPGENIIVPRNEVKSLTQGEVSMMPEGLLQALSDDDVRDLLAYLKSPAQVPLPAVSVNK